MNRTLTALVGVLVVAGAGGAWAVFRQPSAPAAPGAASRIPTSSTQVTRTDVAQRTQVNGTLSFDGSFQVLGAGGVLTRLPALGAVITRGHALYEADGRRVPLLYGARPAWRPLHLGMTDGIDVRQLERNLIALGYDPGTVDRHFSLSTYYAVRAWQHDAHLPVTGGVPLGQAVFLPRAFRVTGYDAKPGAPAQGAVLHGTSAVPVVSVDLDPAQVVGAKVGDRVEVTMPDGSARKGRVSAISPVATTLPAENGPSQSAVPITIRLSGKPVRGLDQTLVEVLMTVEEHKDVLAVPIVALLARPGGTFAVVSGGRQIPVEVGLFDETSGVVEITDGALTEGQSVEVPSDAA